jgi:plasmid stabilization system protein ParE
LARVIYVGQALADLDRLTDFLISSDPLAASTTAELIAEAIAILERHPLIGRGVNVNLRELVISRGRSGYIALYSFEEAADTVLVLGIRHQREAGYAGDTGP